MINLLYPAKCILISGLLFGYYWFFLRNKQFHQYNRFFLLGIPVISCLLPLLNVPVPGLMLAGSGHETIRLLKVSNGQWEEAVTVTPGHALLYRLISFKNVLLMGYGAVAAFLLLAFLRSLWFIRKIAGSYPYQQMQDIQFFETDEPGTPFSFFRLLFWNRSVDLQSTEGKQILSHELFHIRQKHSADIIFLEAVRIAAWFNPFFHLVKKEIRAIHEFLADQHAASGYNRYAYAELLLLQSIGLKQMNIVNPFFQNQIKRRITMITKFQSIRSNYLSRLMTLPLLFMLFCAFALKAKKESSAAPPDKTITVIIDAGHGGIDPGVAVPNGTIEKDINLSIARKIKELAKEYHVNAIMTRETDELPGNTKNIKESLVYRAGIAAKEKADLFMSIHVNADLSDPSANGFDIYVSDQNQLAAKSIAFGSVLSENIKKDYPVSGELKKRDENILVLKHNTVPAVLIECGYMTNPKDKAFITDERNQEKIARDLLEGIVAFSRDNITYQQQNNQYLPAASAPVSEVGDQQDTTVHGHIYKKVEFEPDFPGGPTGWREYLNKHLNYPQEAVSKEIMGDVVVEFIVDTEGNVKNVKAISGPEELRGESVRVVKESGKWIPATEKGKKVNCYKKQPIKYRLEKQS